MCFFVGRFSTRGRFIPLYKPDSDVPDDKLEVFYDYQEGIDGYQSDEQDETDHSDFDPMSDIEYSDNDES